MSTAPILFPMTEHPIPDPSIRSADGTYDIVLYAEVEVVEAAEHTPLSPLAGSPLAGLGIAEALIRGDPSQALHPSCWLCTSLWISYMEVWDEEDTMYVGVQYVWGM